MGNGAVNAKDPSTAGVEHGGGTWIKKKERNFSMLGKETRKGYLKEERRPQNNGEKKPG